MADREGRRDPPARGALAGLLAWFLPRIEEPGRPSLWVDGGRLAVLETKTPIGRATIIQRRKMDRLIAAGALGGYPTCVAEALAICGLD